MFQSVFQGHPLLDLPVLAMVLFAMAFTAVVWRVWRQGPEDPRNVAISRLPLDDGLPGAGGN